MSIPVPISVRLVTGRQDMVVTRDLRDVTFRSTIPGGFASCAIQLNRRLDLTPDEIALYGLMQVSDTRSGEVLWEGRMEDPGRSVGNDGEVWQVAAIGPSAHARDQTIRVVYNDRRLNDPYWVKAYGTSGELISATVSAGEDPAGTNAEGLILHFGNADSTAGRCCTAVYYGLEFCGQNLAYMNYSWDSGLTNVNWLVQGYSSGSNLWRTQASTTAGSGTNAGFQGVDWVLGDRRPVLKYIQGAGGAGGTTDVVWVIYLGLVIVGTRYLKTGVERTLANQPYQTTDGDGILASEVFADLLGRTLNQYDGANAVIDTTTFRIAQLAYIDGATPEKIMEDAMGFEPGTYWAAWERNAAGKYRAEFRRWPTTPQFECDITDGYDAPGSAADLYGAVLVRYRDTQGRIRAVTATQTVPELVAAGITRTGFVDLGDDAGSTAANATQAADTFLDEHRYAPNAGTVQVMRRIMDLTTGRYISPWEVPKKMPGKLVRVRGIVPRVDALNPTDHDGVSIFRVTGADFTASSASASVELESTPFSGRSNARKLAQLVSRTAGLAAARRR